MSLDMNKFKSNEARDMCGDIRSQLEKTSRWCLNNAGPAMTRLHEQWANACEDAESADHEDFLSVCNSIFRDCEAFREQIDRQFVMFTNCLDNRRDTIRQLAGEDPEIGNLMTELLNGWNETILSQLQRLYQTLETLEQSINTTKQSNDDTEKIDHA